MVQLNKQQIFFFELGRFVSQFSKAEAIIFIYLAHILGIKKEECNVLTSGLKVDGCANLIKKVHEARGTNVPAAVLECLEKLGPINKLRNDLLHSYTTRDFVVTNAVRAMPGRILEYDVTPELLQEALFDLAKITVILHQSIGKDELPPDIKKQLTDVKNGPWRYKQPVPKNNRQKNQNKSQGQ
jgi:hypothetical protein